MNEQNLTPKRRQSLDFGVQGPGKAKHKASTKRSSPLSYWLRHGSRPNLDIRWKVQFEDQSRRARCVSCPTSQPGNAAAHPFASPSPQPRFLCEAVPATGARKSRTEDRSRSGSRSRSSIAPPKHGPNSWAANPIDFKRPARTTAAQSSAVRTASWDISSPEKQGKSPLLTERLLQEHPGDSLASLLNNNSPRLLAHNDRRPAKFEISVCSAQAWLYWCWHLFLVADNTKAGFAEITRTVYIFFVYQRNQSALGICLALRSEHLTKIQIVLISYI